MANSKILTAEQEKTLRQPIEEYVGKIQKEIDELRKDGTAKVIMYQSRIENVKRDKTLSKGEKDSEIASCQKELEQAKAVEAQNKDLSLIHIYAASRKIKLLKSRENSAHIRLFMMVTSYQIDIITFKTFIVLMHGNQLTVLPVQGKCQP